jgi:hypothetical protein
MFDMVFVWARRGKDEQDMTKKLSHSISSASSATDLGATVWHVPRKHSDLTHFGSISAATFDDLNKMQLF